MQVGEQNHVDFIGSNAKAAHRNQRRSSAIDQKRAVGRFDEDTGLQASPAAMLIILLALALIGSGFSFIVYATTQQYRATLRAQVTTIVNLTRQAQGTAQARTQATANVWATANARIYA